MSQVMEDDILQVDGELEKLGMFHISREPEKLIEVVIGDVIDPANFRMVFKSELKEIQPMEKILSETIPGQDRSMQNLKVGRLIAVKTKDKTWFRARVLNFYKTFDEKFEIDVDLLDHGITMNGIKYPDCVGTLPSNFQQLESIAFDFKLDGTYVDSNIICLLYTYVNFLSFCKLLPCPFTGPKMFCASTNFLSHLVPLQKLLCRHKQFY